ncbi:MAG: hypothetical protein JOY84_05095 [Curvibacter sp.]|nr:hypothetical protein [Curvibacter sp.]
MNAPALQSCLDRHLAHAAWVYRLDDELGTRHGLSWADFVLLNRLESGGGSEGVVPLARALHTSASHLLLRLLPLEKTGWLARQAEEGGGRRLVLRPPGRRQLREARETAARVCAALDAEGACT